MVNPPRCHTPFCSSYCESNSVLCAKHEALLTAPELDALHAAVNAALAVVAAERMRRAIKVLPKAAQALVREEAKKL